MPDEEVATLSTAVKATDWSLGYAADAISSYRTFCKLREEGVVPQGVRFQVCLPGMSSFAIFVRPQFQYLVEELAYEAMLADVREIVRTIPPHDLALQTDIASDYIKCEAQAHPEVLRTLREDFWPREGENMMERYAKQHAALLDLCPEGVEKGLHICVGNINNEPVVRPLGMGVMVELSNAIGKKLSSGRRLDWVHFGILREWSAKEPYEPLKGLEGEGMKVYLGIVYPEDLEGALKRKEAAEKVLGAFGVGPPCGLARTSDEGVDSVFSILKELTP